MDIMVEKTETPLVSVVIPAYNCEGYIAAAINSVIAQTYPHWELLVIDDGSTDTTCEIVKQWVAKDERIQLVKNASNMGVAKTRNRGLDLSSGEFVTFLDSDDAWRPEKLAIQVQKMMDEDADFLFSSYAIVDAEGKPCLDEYMVQERITFEELLKENVIGCSTVMMRKNLVEKYRFQTDFYHEDYCLWLDILRAGHKVMGCREILVDWRFLSGSRSFDKRKSAINRWRIYRRYLKFSLPKSMMLFLCYAVRGIKKYQKK